MSSFSGLFFSQTLEGIRQNRGMPGPSIGPGPVWSLCEGCRSKFCKTGSSSIPFVRLMKCRAGSLGNPSGLDPFGNLLVRGWASRNSLSCSMNPASSPHTSSSSPPSASSSSSPFCFPSSSSTSNSAPKQTDPLLGIRILPEDPLGRRSRTRFANTKAEAPRRPKVGEEGPPRSDEKGERLPETATQMRRGRTTLIWHLTPHTHLLSLSVTHKHLRTSWVGLSVDTPLPETFSTLSALAVRLGAQNNSQNGDIRRKCVPHKLEVKQSGKKRGEERRSRWRTLPRDCCMVRTFAQGRHRAPPPTTCYSRHFEQRLISSSRGTSPFRSDYIHGPCAGTCKPKLKIP
mmetsp:Transcript_47947/g.94608  ORF Transcript_47947/g.94608 Transcript_47947/m.94608 type:complete len:344 (+) Transcript_47947:659-1690(+)